MGHETFETRAFSLIRGPIWGVFSALFVFCLYLWSQYFIGVLNRGIESRLLAVTAISVLLFVFSSMASFPKIKLEKDGVLLTTGFSSFFFLPNEIKTERDGWVLRLGNWFIGDWIIPFKRKDLVRILGCIEISPPKIPKKGAPIYTIYLIPPVILYLTSYLLKALNIILNSILWATIWGLVLTVSLTMFTYESPINLKIWRFDKKFSCLILNTLLGISIFLFLALTL